MVAYAQNCAGVSGNAYPFIYLFGDARSRRRVTTADHSIEILQENYYKCRKRSLVILFCEHKTNVHTTYKSLLRYYCIFMKIYPLLITLHFQYAQEHPICMRNASWIRPDHGQGCVWMQLGYARTSDPDVSLTRKDTPRDVSWMGQDTHTDRTEKKRRRPKAYVRIRPDSTWMGGETS